MSRVFFASVTLVFQVLWVEASFATYMVESRIQAGGLHSGSTIINNQQEIDGKTALSGSGNVSCPSDPGCVGDRTFNVSASSNVDLATGQIKLATSGSNPFALSLASGYLRDTVIFDTSLTGPIEIGYSLKIHGDIELVGDYKNRGSNASLNIWTSSGLVTHSTNHLFDDILASSLNTVVYSGIIQVNPGDEIAIKYGITYVGEALGIGSSYDIDFSNTATFALDIPDHVEMTSSSKVFLTKPPTSGGTVPAPATLALCIIGLTGLSWSRRKKV